MYMCISVEIAQQEFLMSAGIQVNAPEDVPESHPPLKNKNDAAAAASRSRSAPQRRNHPLKKFLEHDGQILRYIVRQLHIQNIPDRYLTSPL